MKYAYAAVFTPEENRMFSVNFPDLQGCFTSGDDIADAVYMAQDALCLTLYDLEQDKKPIPQASSLCDVKTAGREFASVIAVDTETYRRFYENKPVKKPHAIPM
ncbi:MAG: type II toxin-antitoxin system HicB family antitoxin [Spirochaetes bacterium]|nr:type II toxin-antitoxin system HicB family antitoxin [Spirochaetota bacterium]